MSSLERTTTSGERMHFNGRPELDHLLWTLGQIMMTGHQRLGELWGENQVIAGLPDVEAEEVRAVAGHMTMRAAGFQLLLQMDGFAAVYGHSDKGPVDCFLQMIGDAIALINPTLATNAYSHARRVATPGTEEPAVERAVHWHQQIAEPEDSLIPFPRVDVLDTQHALAAIMLMRREATPLLPLNDFHHAELMWFVAGLVWDCQKRGLTELERELWQPVFYALLEAHQSVD